MQILLLKGMSYSLFNLAVVLIFKFPGAGLGCSFHLQIDRGLKRGLKWAPIITLSALALSTHFTHKRYYVVVSEVMHRRRSCQGCFEPPTHCSLYCTCRCRLRDVRFKDRYRR